MLIHPAIARVSGETSIIIARERITYMDVARAWPANTVPNPFQTLGQSLVPNLQAAPYSFQTLGVDGQAPNTWPNPF